MITDCAYCGILELDDTGFVYDTLQLCLVIVPAALCLLLWRIFVTNRSGPRGGVLVLGLDDSSLVYSDLGYSIVPTYVRGVYLLTSVVTFAVGLLVSDAVNLLLKFLS